MKNGMYGEPVPNAELDGTRTDEELVADLADGRQQALGPLYGRYAGLIFHLAAQSLDRGVAEEIVQEVFLTVWRGAGAFDPAQGAFRPWLMRLAHWRILNELRRRSRRPQQQAHDDANEDEPFQHVPDQEPGPEERAWQNENGQILRSALEALPPKQRQAVALAFLGDLTHEQVAQTLDVPLGTAKTRIRSGLTLLRLRLAPVAASLLGLGLAVVGARYYVQTRLAYERDERALSLVTTSELVPLRLGPVSADLPVNTHANYRGRAGNGLIVLTAEALPVPSTGRSYQAWVRHADSWTSLGTLEPDADGSARLIAEDPALATPPDGVEVTLEPAGGSGQAPNGPVVLAWPSS
jgi:RNA polymerase sigma-70 factor (ECF subfamily)